MIKLTKLYFSLTQYFENKYFRIGFILFIVSSISSLSLNYLGIDCLNKLSFYDPNNDAYDANNNVRDIFILERDCFIITNSYVFSIFIIVISIIILFIAFGQIRQKK